MIPNVEVPNDLPLGVEYETAPWIWTVKKDRNRRGPDGSHPDCFYGQPYRRPLQEGQGWRVIPPTLTKQAFQGWEVREQFLSLSDESEFLEFLNKHGRFSPYETADRKGAWRLKDLKGFQEVFRNLLKYSPTTWGKYAEELQAENPDFNSLAVLIHAQILGVSFRMRFVWMDEIPKGWRKGKYRAVINPDNVTTTILATIYVDHLRGAKFGFCARRDCRTAYEIQSKHVRKYCSESCRHSEAVRRLRKRRKRKPKRVKEIVENARKERKAGRE